MARQHQYLERRLSHKPLRRLASRAAVPTAAGLLVALAAIADEFGAPQFPFPNPIALQNGSYTNFFFPSYSPDNALIVVNASRTTWRSNPARAAGQRLMLAEANGASTSAWN